MTIKLLFRASLAEEDELEVARKYFEVYESRAQIKPGDVVLCRYSFLPYGDELERDVKLIGASLINTYDQHRYVADLETWYYDLEPYTPRTWFDPATVMADEYDGAYVLKGATNSKKNQWKTHMFATSKADLMATYFNLQSDSLIGCQAICIRQFEPFKTYTTSITGQPITKEFRVFVLNGRVMGRGYYWTNYPEVVEEFNPNPNDIPEAWLSEVIDRVKDHIPAFVVDVAEHIDGRYRVVELNDLCMSGISGVDANELYHNLSIILSGRSDLPTIP